MSIKQIARTLGEHPNVIASLVRSIARAETPQESDPGVVDCWVSPGWSSGLTVHDHPEWRDIEDPDQSTGGMALVLVARRHRTNRVSVCGYLVDTHCLGLKNVLGPHIMGDRDLPAFLHVFFDAYEAAGRPLRVPLELARHLVYGGIEAARRLGFEPHPDFPDVAGHLGPWHGEAAIVFGKDGVPCYMAGPYDDARSVIQTLTETLGEDGFTFFAPLAAVY